MAPSNSDNLLAPDLQAHGLSVWTPMRIQLRTWFRANAASLAPAYEGAVEILGDARFPGRINFVAHAVRDIANGLPFALDPQLEGTRVEYVNQLDEIAKEWRSPEQVQDISTTADEVAVSMKTAKLIDQLVNEHRESRKRPEIYERLFRILSKRTHLRASLDARRVKAFKNISKWFVKRAHFPRNATSVNEKDFVCRFEEFERAIFVLVESLLEGSFFAGIGELDDILQQANRSTS